MAAPEDGRPAPAAAVTVARGTYDGIDAVVASWDFGVRGGTFGVAEADAFVAGCRDAVSGHLPLVTVTRSGGTRLQEGMRALVGIPRAVLALHDLAAAGLPHVSVAAHPTTGGVWVSVSSQADFRIGVEGATIGFSGPRVVEAMVGEPLPPGANTAASAAAAGLVDLVVPPDDAPSYVGRALRVLMTPAAPPGGASPGQRAPDDAATVDVPGSRGWQQVQQSRGVPRPSGRELVESVLDAALPLRGQDRSVAAAVGLLDGRPCAAVALTASREERATPAGYRLVVRAAELASRLRMPLVTFVDTVGADPTPRSEDSGVAHAIAHAMVAVLECASPTIAVLHGEGGSGGALAAATTDVVAVTPTGWFAALGPEGAAAALRSSPAEAAELMRIAPADLLDDGFADAMAPGEPAALRSWLAARLRRLAEMDAGARRQRRAARWRGSLPTVSD